MQPITQDAAQRGLDLVRQHGGLRPAARATGLAYRTLYRHYERAREMGLDGGPGTDDPIVRGRIGAMPREEWALPKRGAVARYIFTCAQNNTHLHPGVWKNLKALAAHYSARLCVSTFTYDLASYGAMSVKRGKQKADRGEPWWAPEIEPYVVDQSVLVAPGLVWCGEMNIIPTAARPLSGFESYTGRKSGIFPHPKFAMESIASGKHEGTKINYTTGTVTQRNYIAKKAGQKAEFHHGYGALLVEVDHAGEWFVRQLNADSEGTIYDLTLRARNGKVTDGHRVEAIVWGDIHCGTVAPEMRELLWGAGGMLDTLRPRHQFLHDVLDFRARNHHDARDPHKRFARYVAGEDSVVDEIRGVASFIVNDAHRDWCRSVVIDSNHDNAMTRWLRESDYRSDPPNALFFLEAQARVYKSIAEREDFHLVEWAVVRIATMHGAGARAAAARFLRQDDSYIICPDANGGIECGMHGHLGPNGMRGSANAFARMGRKSNVGHSHSAGIVDGVYVAGITGALEQGYNAGPSSWSHSHIVTYANGKRAIVTCYHGKWRAL